MTRFHFCSSFKNVLGFICIALGTFSSTAYSSVTWSSPTTISTIIVNASDPQIVIDSYGNATAAWVESNIVKISYRPFSGSWSVPLQLSTILTTASNPKIALNGNGDVIAVWRENTRYKSTLIPVGGNTSGLTIFQLLGIIILPPTNILNLFTDTLSNTGATNVDFAVDASGNAVAVWVRSTFIESATYVSGSWSGVSILSAANSTNPSVAINNNNKAIAAWNSVVSGADEIVTRTLTVSSNTWATSITAISDIDKFHNYPKVTIDDNGNASMVWYRYSFLNGNAYLNTQVIGSYLPVNTTSWNNPDIISQTGLRNPADLDLKIGLDTYGNALAVWTNSHDGESFVIESSRKISGGFWSPFVTTQSPNLYTLGFDFSISSGKALLTNMAWDEISSLIIQSQEGSINPLLQTWSIASSISDGSQNGYPKCAIALKTSTNTFNTASVWINDDGLTQVIRAAIGSAPVVSPPTSVSATQLSTDFNVYTDYYNTLTWSASSEPDIAQYNIYRNGVYCTATPSDVLEFIDNNAVQDGTVIYGVAAMDFDFNQSQIVTFTLNP